MNALLISFADLNSRKYCTVCGTILEIDLNIENLSLPARYNSDEYAHFQEIVNQTKTDHHTACETIIGNLENLSQVDEARAKGFIHTVFLEDRIDYGPKWLAEQEFEGLTEFPSSFSNWNDSRPLLANSVESVLLIALWVSTFQYGIFDQLAKYALVSSDPVSHLCADHQADWPSADDMCMNSLYVVRTSEQQYLCYDKPHFLTPPERLRRIQGR
jgi:hypothetical protein